MKVKYSVKLNWCKKGETLISIEVDGEQIDPEEFKGYLEFMQDLGVEIKNLEIRMNRFLTYDEEINTLLRIIKLKTRKIKQDHC